MNLDLLDIKFDLIKNQLINALDIEWQVARLDLIHPIVSGNKLFKLYFYVQNAIAENKNVLVTKGGAYSNHLVASAYYAHSNGLNSIGIVRGDESAHQSHTLQQCMAWGMRIVYVSRADYPVIDEENIHQFIPFNKNECFFIAEGGYGKMGTKGASLIMDYVAFLNPDYITISAGTACTLSGLLTAKKNKAKIIAVPAIKGFIDLEKKMCDLLETENTDFDVFEEYHFGGYAKKNIELIEFMNSFYTEHKIPTDFVYTGKMMFAIMEKIKCGYFPKGSKIVSIHTGGLQGNQSLPKGTLVF